MENFSFNAVEVTSLYKGLYNTLIISKNGQVISNFIHKYRAEINK